MTLCSQFLAKERPLGLSSTGERALHPSHSPLSLTFKGFALCRMLLYALAGVSCEHTTVPPSEYKPPSAVA